ncbi:MAG: DNA (cytosine-5-)-methyltransferase [Oscillospiraceae bacterium]|nr:DNA (cytosine-5-)-methyltransferase [Oscillospiraceae bacterium]
MKNMVAISLFSGAGGMDIGVKKAGLDVLAEFEIDKYCCETLRAAVERERTNTVVYETDIQTVDPTEISKDLNIKPLELDLLFGGPPCQPFSLAGKQNGLSDTRGPLLFEIIRFAKHFKPKVIFLEQVKGLLSAKDSNGKKAVYLSNSFQNLKKLDTYQNGNFVALPIMVCRS